MKKAGLMIFLLLAGVLHGVMGWRAVWSLAATYDEPIHVAAGTSYWKTGRYGLNGLYHPPAAEMTATLPVVLSGVPMPVQDPYWIAQRWTPQAQYRFADRFVYHNRVAHHVILGRARLMQLGLSCLLVVGIGVAAASAAGPGAGVVAALLAACSTTLLANGTLVTNDLLFSLGYFFFFALLPLRQSKWGCAALGLCLALCLGSKYSAVAVAGSIGALAGWRFVRTKSLGVTALQAGLVALTAIGGLLAFYRFTEAGLYLDGLKNFMAMASTGRSSYFFGEHRTTGFLAYFPMAFLMKTEIPVLIGLLLSGLAFGFKKRAWPARFIWPPLIFFAIVLMSKVQIGQRYLLPIYPFVLVLAAGGLWSGPTFVKWFLSAAAVIWMTVGAVRISPHYLTYFNELSGGPQNGHRYFTDSNLDWGQGLSFVPAAIGERGRAEGIYLCYFGVADPHAYGLRYKDVASDALAGHVDDSQDPALRPTLFVISATNLRATYYADKTLFQWLDAFQPAAMIANSLFLYDFKDNPAALARLEALHRMTRGQ